MSEQLIKLELLADNPYQPRTVDVPEDIEKLARSIAADGLLQVPKARKNGKGFQLAFGHSRRKAFEWLAAFDGKIEPERYNHYTCMPVEVVELTDEEMYRHAITENVQRKDLNPIELAKALERYMREFNANSKQAGELFGMNDATVRGKVRMLELSEPVQEKVAAGVISESVAREFHSLQKIAPQEVVIEALEAVEKGVDHWGDPVTPQAIINDILDENDDEILEMWSGDGRKEKPRSSHHGGGWLLDMKNFPNKFLPILTPVDAACALGIQDDEAMMEKVATWIQASNGELPDIDSEALGIPENLLEKLHHLFAPPTCSACPFHSIIHGDHYCGMKVCHGRKQQAWDREQLRATSKSLGIAIYDPETDGKEFRVLEDHYHGTHEHWELWQKKNKDLRLALMVDIDRQRGQAGYSLPKSVCVLLVGKTLKDLLTQHHDERVEKRQKEEAVQTRAVYWAEKSEALAWEASKHIRVIFDGLNEDALEALWQSPRYGHWEYSRQDTPDESQNDIGAVELRRCLFVMNMICEEANWLHGGSKTLEAYAIRLTELAKTWGVKLPKSIMKTAQQFDAGMPGVSAETPKQKKTKK